MTDRTRNVLIVDDDPQILRLVEEVLAACNVNVNVLVAPKAADALRICGSQDVDLLISDVMMPEMDGTRLAERVAALHPKTGVLLISGYCAESPVAARLPQARFLRKPFFPSDLLRHLRELLPGG